MPCWRLPRTLITLGLATIVLIGSAPLVGWLPTVRLSWVLGPAALLAALWRRPWRWSEAEWQRLTDYEPSSRHIAIAAAVAGLLLFWIVLSLFHSGHINAVDFTVYFDRPLYQTIHGRPLYVETTDDPSFDHLTHFAVHAYWILLPLSLLYKVAASPMWLLALSVIAVIAGSVHVLRIGRQVGFGGLMACAAALAFLLNDNTARAIRYGFHPELLYAWFIPWMLDAGLRGAKRQYLAAAIACVLVQESALLPIFGAVATLAILRGRVMTPTERVVLLALPLLFAGANLALFYTYVVPRLSPAGEIMYASMWGHYGSTPVHALVGMARQPLSVARDIFTSALIPRVLPPFLFLPLIGWRWSIGILPIVIIFATSAHHQLRGFSLYYAIYLVPFLALAAAAGGLTVMRRILPPAKAPVIAAAIIVLGALVVGRGYALRSWRSEVAAVPRALELLAGEQVVLVQSSLYPHAGYSSRVQLLTARSLRDPANSGAVVLIAPRLGAFPLRRREITPLLRHPPIATMPGGLIAIRNGQGGASGGDPTN